MYNMRTPPETKVTHAVQSLHGSEPLHLLGSWSAEDSVILDILNQETQLPARSKFMRVAGELDSGRIEDIR